MPEKGAREHVGHKVDLSSASEQELAEVSDIGKHRAKKIVEHRNKHGAFHNIDDLTKIEGFGPTLKDDLRNALTISKGKKAA